MKRWLILLTACLLAGAALNVAVAWACALWGPGPALRIAPPGATRWPAPPPEGWPAACNELMRGDTWAVSFDVALHPGQPRPDYPFEFEMFAQSVGWPLRSMRRCITHHNGTLLEDLFAGVLRPETWREGVVVPSWVPLGGSHRVLPLLVIWPGFAANSALYGLAVLALVSAPFYKLHRRRGRARRGQCLACGYPVGALPVCSECGQAVDPQRAAAELARARARRRAAAHPARPWTRRRALRLVLVAVALGTALNVAVAWACTLAPLGPERTGRAAGLEARVLARPGGRLHARSTAEPFAVTTGQLPGFDVLCHIGPAPVAGAPAPGRFALQCEAGLPWRSFWAEATSASFPTDGDRTLRGLFMRADAHNGTVPLHWPGETRRHAPMRPIIAGLAANTALYATALAALWLTPALLRATSRRLRGRCRVCGWEVGTTRVCEVCGTSTERGAEPLP